MGFLDILMPEPVISGSGEGHHINDRQILEVDLLTGNETLNPVGIPTNSNPNIPTTPATPEISDRERYKPGIRVGFDDPITPVSYAFPAELRESLTDMPFFHLNVVDPIAPLALRSKSTFAVALPLPKSIRNTYGANYDTAELGIFLGYVAENMNTVNVKNIGSPGAMLAQGTGGKGLTSEQIQKRIIQSVGDKILYMTGTNLRAVEKGTRFVVNNHAAVLFKSMDFRSFNCEFDLFPKSAADSRNIEEIIFQLKYAMHPEGSGTDESGSGTSTPTIAATSTGFNWPQNFILGFYGPKKTQLFKTSPCAMTNLSVEYIQNGVTPSFFEGTYLPTGYSLSLQFTEMEMITKARIRQGW